MIRLGIVAVLVAGIALAAWRQVGSWAGQGTKQTQSFQITNREWRISWKAQPTHTVAVLNIGVYDDTDNMVSTITSGTKGGADVSYVRSQPGRYYLKISAANVTWAVIAEDQ